MVTAAKPILPLVLAMTVLLGCGSSSNAQETTGNASADASAADGGGGTANAVATFAGGCFWCMEPPYDKLPGVASTISGYTGGHLANPSYKQVGKGNTGHYEAVQITYDPDQVSYEQLLHVFWRNIDPLDKGGQFCDRGEPYRTAVFFHDAEQEALAIQSKADVVKRFEATVVTPLVEASAFYPAEDYHQDYYEKNPFRYKLYRRSCGRDNRLEQVWGDEAGGLAAGH
jgi:peptide-methionine (S)-S-oxide reductase